MTYEDPNSKAMLETPGSDGQPSMNGNGQPDAPMDAASLSVSSALRTSFLALKIVLLAMIVMYLGSGYFTLSPGHKAVVVQFGQIKGLGGQPGPVLDAGAHWTWPWPISHVVQENTEKTRTMNLQSFWFYVDDRLKGLSIDDILKRARPPEQLVPGVDGYLLTGEQEILHLQCAIRYKIDNLVNYVQHVNTEPREVLRPLNPGEWGVVLVPGEEYLLQTIADWACTQTVAAMPTDEIVRGDDGRFRGEVRQRMQQRLDALESGISVTDIIVEQRTVPLQVRAAYLAVVQAEAKRNEVVITASRDATQKLYEVAGASYVDLSQLIEQYELARALGEKAQADRHLQDIMKELDEAGGRVSHLVGTAAAEATRRGEQVKAEVERFNQLYPAYLENPRLFMAQHWADTKQEILTNPEVERVFLPFGNKEIRLMLGHNPEFLRDREVGAYTRQTGQ